jgi:hypothetical protein
MNRHGLESEVVLRKTVRPTNNFYVDKGFCITEFPALNPTPPDLPKRGGVLHILFYIHTKLIAQ